MDTIIDAIPKSTVSLVGLAVILFLLRIVWTFAEEWAKTLYRTIRGHKEKRQDTSTYNGYERRIENKDLQVAITELIHNLSEERKEMTEFRSSWKEYKSKVVDDVDEIKRKQDKNWKRLFDEELPALHHP